MAETVRVELKGDLAGHHLLLDPEELTLGMLDDIQTGKVLDALAAVIVGGDLPKGTDRAGLRRLKIGESKSVIQGVGSAFEIGKS